MPDPRFAETVILLASHSTRGATGFIVNQPTGQTLEPLSHALNIDPPLHFEVYWGGPVTPDTMWLLHSADWETDNTMYINSEWRVTSTPAMFHHAADGDMPKYFRWLAGSCAWAPGQLIQEMSGEKPYAPGSSWITLDDVESEWVWESDPDKTWDESLHHAGNQFATRYL
jgi:putative transcriptional regulator